MASRWLSRPIRRPDRHVDDVGALEVDDKSKIQVLQVEDDGPSDILWRVALPASQTWTFEYNTPVGGGGASTWMQSDSREMLVRARIMQDRRLLGFDPEQRRIEVGPFFSN